MDSIVIDLGLLFMGFIFATGRGSGIRIAGNVMMVAILFHIVSLFC